MGVFGCFFCRDVGRVSRGYTPATDWLSIVLVYADSWCYDRVVPVTHFGENSGDDSQGGGFRLWTYRASLTLAMLFVAYLGC